MPAIDQFLRSQLASLSCSRYDHALLAGWGWPVNDQIVELESPGLQLIMYSPFAVALLDDGGDYSVRFPDGRDLVDYLNDCRMGALGTRWPNRDHWLHFSSTLDQRVITRACDHVRIAVEVSEGQLCIRSGDDLFAWDRRCPNEQLISVENGYYDLTACMLPDDGEGPIRIYIHLAVAMAKPDLGYERVPELFGQPAVW